ncbi:MAG: hypothetical protein LUC16_02705 [Coprobacillus sp.]|nr:hypothetical protein [Coprobacillus sp.]
MSKKKKTQVVDEAQMLSEAAEAVSEEIVEETTEEIAEAVSEATEAAEPVVYIGPDIKHVARKGTIYTDGLPKTLEAKIEEIPAIRGLIVPTSKLATAEEAMARQGTALNNLFEAVREKLNKTT